MSSEFLTKVGIVVAVFAVAFIGKIGYSRMQISSFNKHGEYIAIEFTSLQDEHYSQFKQYQPDFNKLTSRTLLQEINPAVTVYHDQLNMPLEYTPLVERLGPPFMTKDDYRLFIEVKNAHDQKVYFWVVNPKRKPELLATDITFNLHNQD